MNFHHIISVTIYKMRRGLKRRRRILLLFPYGNPNLVFHVLRVGIKIYFYIRAVSIFITGSGQPVSDDTPLQFLNRNPSSSSAENRPSSRRQNVLLKFSCRCRTANCEKISPVISLFVAGTDAQEHPWVGCSSAR